MGIFTPGGASSGSSEVLAATVTLTAADLADLATGPFELVASPGANKAALVLAMAFGGSAAPADSETYPVHVTYGDDNLDIFSVSEIPAKVANAASYASRYPAFLSPTSYALDPRSQVDTAINLTLNGYDPLPIPGAIVTSAIAAAGTGYVALETVTRGDATIRIDTVGGSGEVLTYTVTVAGTNNIIGTAQATTGGSGADFTVDITALDYSVNPMTLTVKTIYSVMDV